MPAPTLTPEVIQRVWARLGSRWQFKVVPKSSAQGQQIGAIAVALKIVRPETWVQDYVTFLPLPEALGGPTVFTPFAVGAPTVLWPLESQLLVGVHEAVHAAHYLEDPHGFIARYANPSGRADEERAARASAECVRFRLWRATSAPQEAVAALGPIYHCSADDVHVAEVDLQLDIESIRDGALLSPAAALVLELLGED